MAKDEKALDTLKFAMRQKNITQKMLAEKTGHTNSQINKWLLGVNKISLVEYLELCDAVGLKIAYGGIRINGQLKTEGSKGRKSTRK